MTSCFVQVSLGQELRQTLFPVIWVFIERQDNKWEQKIKGKNAASI